MISSIAPMPRRVGRATKPAAPWSSPVSGVLVGVDARTGDRVRRGQALATVEAMKMQYVILAPIDGLILSAPGAVGSQVPARALLFEIESSGDA